MMIINQEMIESLFIFNFPALEHVRFIPAHP